MSENYELWLENSEYLGLSLNIEEKKKKKIQWNWREYYICRCWPKCRSGHWKYLTVPTEIAEGLFFLSGSTAGFVSTFHLWQSGLKLWMSSYCLPVKQTLEMSLACAYLYSSVYQETALVVLVKKFTIIQNEAYLRAIASHCIIFCYGCMPKRGR